MPSPADCQPDHPFLQYLVTVLAVYEQQPKTAPIARYDGPTDGYTADITRLLERLVQRMYTAEDALRNLQASQTETRETRHSATSADTLPSRPSSASLATSGSDSITDNNIPQAPSHQAALSSSLPIDPNPITPTTSDPDTSATDELSNLKAQVQGISNVCDALARGDLSQKITVTVQDAALVQVKDAINSTIDKLSRYSQELARVSWDVGVKGLFGGQVDVTNNVEGVWLEMARNVNRMFAHVTNQVRSIGKVTTGIARGNFEYNLLDMEVEGEMLWIKGNLDKTMGLLNGFATEVTRVTQDIGTHGKLGYQARIADTSGTWENLKNGINVMAANLTVQIRTIALAISAVTRGDFTQSIVGLSVSGEMLELVNNINRLVDQLRTNNIHT